MPATRPPAARLALLYYPIYHAWSHETSKKGPHDGRGNPRSSDRSILVLTSLASGPKHGYALIKDIEAFAGIKMGPGTLYGCLSKLERAGLVEALPAEDRRHPYRITVSGLEAVKERLTESGGSQNLASAESREQCHEKLVVPLPCEALPENLA